MEYQEIDIKMGIYQDRGECEKEKFSIEWKLATPSVVQGLAESPSPGSLLDVQGFQPCPRLSQNLYFNNIAG